MNNQRTIEETIREKQIRQDKNGKEYLLLKLENEEAIFVFSSKVKSDDWELLQEGKRYVFAVEEGNNANNLLIFFEDIYLSNTHVHMCIRLKKHNIF